MASSAGLSTCVHTLCIWIRAHQSGTVTGGFSFGSFLFGLTGKPSPSAGEHGPMGVYMGIRTSIYAVPPCRGGTGVTGGTGVANNVEGSGYGPPGVETEARQRLSIPTQLGVLPHGHGETTSRPILHCMNLRSPPVGRYPSSTLQSRTGANIETPFPSHSSIPSLPDLPRDAPVPSPCSPPLCPRHPRATPIARGVRSALGGARGGGRTVPDAPSGGPGEASVITFPT